MTDQSKIPGLCTGCFFIKIVGLKIWESLFASSKNMEMIYVQIRKGIILFTVILVIALLSSCRQSNNSNKQDITVATEDTSTSFLKKHTVTFKDYNEKILKIECIDDGSSVNPPINAAKDGYKIVGWDKPLDNIKEDIIVTPIYEKISGPTILINNISAKAGDTVKISVMIQNNPGINGATIKILFDSNLILKKAKNGDALNGLKYTEPGEYENPSVFLWDGIDQNIKENGEMLVLTFKISDKAKSGDKLGVSVSYTEGSIYDKDLKNVDFDVVGGSITIE